MIWGIILIVLALIIGGEVVYCMINSKTASDFTYYFCRPFGIEMKEKWGILVRILLIVSAACSVMKGFNFISQSLNI